MDKERRRKQHSLNKKRRQFKTHKNWHHVYPTSRFKLRKDPALHTAWHDVFKNETPEDAMEIVGKWIAEPKKFKKEIASDPRRLNAWQMLFGESVTPSDKTIKTIEEDWTFPGVKMIKTKETF